jgi:hypothetical protein
MDGPNKRLNLACEEIAELRAEVERLRAAQTNSSSNFSSTCAAPAAVTVEKDAERYRWLREKSVGQWEHPIVVEQMRAMDRMQYIGPLSFDALDKRIDAAIEAHTKAGKDRP